MKNVRAVVNGKEYVIAKVCLRNADNSGYLIVPTADVQMLMLSDQ